MNEKSFSSPSNFKVVWRLELIIPNEGAPCKRISFKWYAWYIWGGFGIIGAAWKVKESNAKKAKNFIVKVI